MVGRSWVALALGWWRPCFRPQPARPSWAPGTPQNFLASVLPRFSAVLYLPLFRRILWERREGKRKHWAALVLGELVVASIGCVTSGRSCGELGQWQQKSLRGSVRKAFFFLNWNIGLFREGWINPFVCCCHTVTEYQVLQELFRYVCEN